MANTRSMGVGLSPTIIPAAGKPTFEIGDDEMEIGIGIHGEPGSRRTTLETADQIADEIMGALTADLDLGRGDRVAVLVNGLGATPLEELYILYRRVKQILDGSGVVVHRPYVGEYADEPRDGRGVDHPDAARRPADGAPRRAGPIAVLPAVTRR